MSSKPMTEQVQAEVSGPRALSEVGSPQWCWQTISFLQTLWKSLNVDLGLYEETWEEAEQHKVWDKIPYESPYGTKEEMLRRLEIGDVPAARAKVAQKAMDTRPSGRSSADYLTTRIARNAPEVWERMKRGEFKSVAEAAREAGIKLSGPKKTVTLGDDVEKVADKLKAHYTPNQLRRIRDRLADDSG